MTSPEKHNNGVTKLAFEEYELYYKSTEKVTEWRLAINRWNYSICTAVVIAFAVILNWATSHPAFLPVACVAIILLCAMGMLFCSLWVGQIKAYKNLNDAKFKVLQDMAPHISFSSSSSDERVSYSPFKKEWETLEAKRKALEELVDTNIIALKSSRIEYWVPKVFRFLFGLILVATVFVAIVNQDLILTSTTLTFQTTPTVIPVATPAP